MLELARKTKAMSKHHRLNLFLVFTVILRAPSAHILRVLRQPSAHRNLLSKQKLCGVRWSVNVSLRVNKRTASGNRRSSSSNSRVSKPYSHGNKPRQRHSASASSQASSPKRNKWSCKQDSPLWKLQIKNLDRLNVAIRGQAYQSVASLMWTCGSPDDVVHALEQTYARPELLVAREVADLRNTQKLSSAQDLNTLANKLRNFITTLTLLKQTEYLFSPELFRCILVKMSEHTRSRFTDYATAHTPEQQSVTKLELLSRFLLIEADKQLKFNFVADSTVKAPTPPAYSNVPRNNAPKFPLKKETIHTTVSNETTSEHCTYCKQGSHKIKTCKSFLKLIVEDRWRWVRETKICYRCLKSNPHTWNNCRAKRCGIDGCPRRHNALLHGTGTTETNSGTAPSDQCNNLQTSSENSIRPVIINSTDNDITSAKIANTIDCSINATGSSPSTSLPRRPRGLLKVVPIVLEGPGGAFETTALLDDGSISTLIDADVAARIGAKPTSPERLRIEGVSNMSTELDVHAADIIEAEKMLVRQAQRESFPEELTNLRSSKPVPKDSRIKKLAPILDEEGLMRQDTRIISAPGVNNETKSPMILDGRHYISRLIIFHEHVKASHQFNELVLNELRQRFSIPRARGTIRSVASSCLKCKRWNTKPMQPQIDAPEAITPFHFILGSSSVVPWTTSLTDADLSRRCDWRRTLRLADHFWARWLREYLPTLRQRGPNNNNLLNLGEGDVVLIADPTLPRGLWPLGRVAKVYLGPDGAVRVADVHTKGGVLRRPARKLILMEAATQPATTSG
ncbi:uncharacterized protein LOC125242022 [Leguminivora glycinivorella]|uniref:uncharacterized protein LOC125242022 n=2 Tax=Leguminivora glycinivorella TaxID=1035111 RepID=UPI00200C9607|nr:uncharacterized protein LOC125242022 [Leguminivora glycinivorella]